MKLLFLFMFLIFIAIIVVVIVLYFSYEKPIAEVPPSQLYCNLSIACLDNNEKVKTQYAIVIPGFTNYSGEVTDKSYTRDYVNANSSFFIYNQNYEGQTYYTSFLKIDRCDNYIVKRTEIDVNKYGTIKVDYTGNLTSDEPIILNVSVNGTILNPKFCMKWPVNIVIVSPNKDFPVTGKPSHLDGVGVDSCYLLKSNLSDSSQLVTLTYDRFGKILFYDSLDIYIIDSDYRYTNNSMLLVDDENLRDIGIPDFKISIK